MKSGSQFKNLLKELGRDPRLKQVIAKAKRQTRRKGEAKVENVTGVVLLLLAFASRFVTKKRARALDELMDVIYLLVQVSGFLKENIFERPEVKEFFGQSSRQIYLLAQECLAMALPKTKELRPVRRSRLA
jgi:predicted house-cleaning noncanonical NTP pyrophosphatase (MazG superfamily)